MTAIYTLRDMVKGRRRVAVWLYRTALFSYGWTVMDIAEFADLLAAAKAQPEPQRLLLVFVCDELPEDASAE
jgi:hypothetical protein